MRPLAAVTAALAGLLALTACTSGGDPDVMHPTASGDLSTFDPAPVITTAAIAEVTAPEIPAHASAIAQDAPEISVEPDPPPSPSPADPASGGAAVPEEVSASAVTLAQQLFDLANAARAERGLPAYTWTDCGAQEARERAVRAQAKADLQHEPLHYTCGATYVGENLVRAEGTASVLHELWMNSPGHRGSILSPDFVRLGVGCVAYGSGGKQDMADSMADAVGWTCSQMFYA